MLDRVNHSYQTALSERYAELLKDIELVAERANAVRKGPDARRAAADITEAAEAAHIRVLHEWKRSRGGRQHNLFFDPLAKRLRRIIDHYRIAQKTPPVPDEGGGQWVYKILDYEQIPWHRLAPWLRASAVDDAIQTGILLGLRELPGLRIWQETTSDD